MRGYDLAVLRNPQQPARLPYVLCLTQTHHNAFNPTRASPQVQPQLRPLRAVRGCP
ncbi:MAG: hypothetical protein OXH00_21690 [Candidatus Poribacteria bacterium]|nr:hypothetical protein [Candidatus Poribacteria bacterium]